MNETMVWGEDRLRPRITAVKPMDDYALLLTFDNGETRIFSAKPLLSIRAFEPLRNRGLFEAAQVAYGSVAWPGDIDCCPDTLYEQSIPWLPGTECKA